MSKKRRVLDPDLDFADEGMAEEEMPGEEGVAKPAEQKGSAEGAELTELQRGFKERAQRERERFEDAVDTEYWFCVCFQSRDHKERFLKAIGLLEYGDKYLDGDVFADAIGLDYDAAARRPEWGEEKKIPEKVHALVRDEAKEGG